MTKFECPKPHAEHDAVPNILISKLVFVCDLMLVIWCFIVGAFV